MVNYISIKFTQLFENSLANRHFLPFANLLFSFKFVIALRKFYNFIKKIKEKNSVIKRDRKKVVLNQNHV